MLPHASAVNFDSARACWHSGMFREGYWRRNVIGFSVVDEIEKLDRLKRSGSITDDEFTRLRTKLVEAA